MFFFSFGCIFLSALPHLKPPDFALHLCVCCFEEDKTTVCDFCKQSSNHDKNSVQAGPCKLNLHLDRWKATVARPVPELGTPAGMNLIKRANATATASKGSSCSVSECGNPLYKQGYCTLHYNRHRDKSAAASTDPKFLVYRTIRGISEKTKANLQDMVKQEIKVKI
eukprot:g42421.t1